MYLQQGFSDNPQTSDALGIEACCQGIADFVRTCSTPMTLAIQGDWGTGKTTAMNLIGNCLQKAHPEGVCMITFNTWQFSVLNENEKLIVDLMNVMLARLEEWSTQFGLQENQDVQEALFNSRKWVRGLQIAASVVLKTARQFVAERFPGLVGTAVNEVINTVETAPEQPEKAEETVSRTEIAANLKDSIGLAIQRILESSGAGDRIYVFIDDLDRLEPRTAVELLEGLKNFADFENCVFLLAVDREVVERGLQNKYGNDFDKQKARNFFDKMIQVPFSLPVSAYDMNQYIRSFISDSDEIVSQYVQLLSVFRERNPRTIKRSFNVLQLNECIETAKSGKKLSPEQRLKLYAVLLLQLEHREDFEEVSMEIENHSAEIETQDYRNFCKSLYQLVYPQDDEDSVARMAYLPEILRLFFNFQEEDASQTQGAQIQEFIDFVSRTRAASSPAEAEPLRRVRVMQKLYRTLKAHSALKFSPQWNQLTPEQERTLAESGKSVRLTAELDGQMRIKLTWSGGESLLNLTVYQPGTRKKVFRGVEDNFCDLARTTGKKPHQYGYYWIEGQRIAVSEFSSYQENGALDTLLENCGILHE